MKRAFIFANGRMEYPPAVLNSLKAQDLIIAADGGAQHCKALGITPKVIIGDFDSLDTQEVASYQREGVEILRHPSRKNETDLELALQYAKEQNASEVYIIGALGARWDMSLANILMIAHPAYSSLEISLLDGKQEFFILRGGEQAEITSSPGELLSLIPVGGDAHGITTQGLEYPLQDETLHFGTARGVSNAFTQNNARIGLSEGRLLCIFTRLKNGELSKVVYQKEGGAG